MSRKTVLLFSLVLVMILSTGCYKTYTEDSYFDGDVTVKYERKVIVENVENNDFLTFQFNKKGTYEIYFSSTPGQFVPEEYMCKLEDTVEIIDTVPKEFVVKTCALPSFLRVMITRDGTSEYHDFTFLKVL